jgi:hypothetical protein
VTVSLIAAKPPLLATTAIVAVHFMLTGKV